jgi:hypothetical protein
VRCTFARCAVYYARALHACAARRAVLLVRAAPPPTVPAPSRQPVGRARNYQMQIAQCVWEGARAQSPTRLYKPHTPASAHFGPLPRLPRRAPPAARWVPAAPRGGCRPRRVIRLAGALRPPSRRLQSHLVLPPSKGVLRLEHSW